MSTRVVPLPSLTSALERAAAGGRYTSPYDTPDPVDLHFDTMDTSIPYFTEIIFEHPISIRFKTLNYELSLRHRASLRRYDESGTG